MNCETKRKQRHSLPSRQGGFTLIEMLVVVVIIGLLSSIVAPMVFEALGGAQQSKAFADFKNIQTALGMYRLDNFTYPSSEQGLEALKTKSNIEPIPRKFKPHGYLQEVPLDPWNRPYLYLYPGENGEVDIYTLGADGLPGGQGDNMDIGNWMNPNDLDSEGG